MIVQTALIYLRVCAATSATTRPRASWRRHEKIGNVQGNLPDDLGDNYRARWSA
jgi:hypothetical protein